MTILNPTIFVPQSLYRATWFAVAPGIFLLLASFPVLGDDRPVDFATQILPILSGNCFACHGPDANHREADLRLDVEDAAKEHAIIPERPEDSELIARIITDDEDLRMPPPDTGKTLTAAQIQLLQQWIAQGAPWARHWAFVPPRRQAVPQVDGSDWPQNEIDHFVLARLRQERLPPNEAASRATWLRRVSFDLTGLPPTPAEVAQFVADDSTEAFESQVDRLLRSPHYGERLAIDWLDLARYADTNGYQNDFNRSMWPWRDWVIQAFNENMPADQFLTEQLAGDLFPNPTKSQLIATGFNRNHRTVTEAGSIDEEWRVENVVDRVETTATAFLGLTMGCARCHDHKYDPISRRDFYQFFAFFNNVDEQGVYTETRGNVAPLLQVPTAEETEKLAEFDRQIVELEQQSSHTEVDAAQFLGTADDMSLNDLPTPQLQLLFNQQLLAQAVPHEATKRASAESVRFTGESIPWKEGPIGAGVDFSGDPAAYVDAGQAFVIDADRPFSWSLWARVDGPGAFLSKMDDQHGFRGYDTIVLDDFRLKVHLIDTWPNNALAVTTKSAVPKDKWFHLTVSYDGSRQAEGIHLWLDGRPLALNFEQRNLSGSLLTDQPLRLGRRSTALYFDGSIADVRFYTQSLTAEQDARMLRRDLHARLAGQPLTADTIPPTVREYLKSQQNHELQEQLQTLRSARESLANSVQTTMIMRDRSEYRPTYLLRRGQYDLPDESEALWPQLPEFLGELPTDAPRNRLGLAHSLIQPDHPLVARVMVNRIWQRMFGRGIVPTPDNFGVQGDPPSHPELLDWLAIHFIESGWDVKQLHKMIALSATYRQSARSSAELQARDPYNRLLARGPRHRLPAELVRDNALAVSGLLSSKIGGPSVKPYQPAGLWDELAGGANGGPYQVADGPDLYRRSLYTFRKRTVSHPTLGTFDAPSWEICQAKRPTTNTPLQALALLNDLTYVEAAAHLAVRMQSESSVSASASDRIRLGFELALLRSPSDQELSTLEAGFAKYADFYRSRPESAKQFLSQGKSQVADDRKTPELAALATIAAVILNLDETITE